MTDFLEGEREEGKKRSTYAVHSLRLLTCLQPTLRVQLVSLNPLHEAESAAPRSQYPLRIL